MRVCLVCDSLHSSDGPGRHASNLVRSLGPSLEAIEICLPTSHGSVDDDLDDAHRVHRILPSRHLFFLNRLLFFPLVAWKALRLTPIARRAQVVHSIKDYPFSLIATLAAAMAGRPLVITVHGTFGTLPFQYRGHAAALRQTYERAERVLCVSRYTRDRLIPHVDERKLEIIPSGVDPSFLSFLSDSDAEAREADPPFLLTVALVRGRKGLDISIAAFLAIADEFPRLRYLIAGRFLDDVVFRQLQELIRDHPAGNRVEFLGEVDETTLRKLYAGCTAFVMTPRTDRSGRFEGLGLVYLEAGAFGKPVIGASGCGAEDAIVDGETGLLVAPEDPDATAQAMGHLLRSSAERTRLGEAGRTRAQTATWDETAARVLSVYEAL
jgi:phosphatidylinositol alpha-1,6-mannosyltransferase